MGYRGSGEGGRALVSRDGLRNGQPKTNGLPKTWTVSSFGSWAQEREPDTPPTVEPPSKLQLIVTIVLVALWCVTSLCFLWHCALAKWCTHAQPEASGSSDLCGRHAVIQLINLF